MIESRYTQAIHKKLPKSVYHWKIGDKLVGGVPDAFYRNRESMRGKPLWVEYKLIKNFPAKGATVVKPNLSANQFTWLSEAFYANENVWVVLGCEATRDKHGIKSCILRHPEVWRWGLTSATLQENQPWLSYAELGTAIAEITA